MTEKRRIEGEKMISFFDSLPLLALWRKLFFWFHKTNFKAKRFVFTISTYRAWTTFCLL